MFLDFSKITLPEGVTIEIMADSAIQDYIKTEYERREQAAVSAYTTKRDKAVQDKAIAEQKVDDLKKRIGDLEKGKHGDIRAEYQGQIDALTKQIESEQSTSGQLKKQLDQSEVRMYLNSEIQKYNAAHKSAKVLSGAEDYVIDAGLQTFRKTEDGAIRAYDGDTALTGAGGFMTGAEFVSKFREQKEIFFERPAGGGAPGGSNGGASKTMTRSEFDKLMPTDKAKVAQEFTITD